MHESLQNINLTNRTITATMFDVEATEEKASGGVGVTH